MAFWDIAAAFPSVAWQFLFAVLHKTVNCVAFRNVVRGVYRLAGVWSEDGQLAFMILRGVLQGCPLSGLLFALAMDPCIRLFGRKVPEPRGFLRVCADDIAAVTFMADLQGFQNNATHACRQC